MTDDYRPRCYPTGRVHLGGIYIYEPPEGEDVMPRACQVVFVHSEGQMCTIFCPPTWQGMPLMVQDVPHTHLFVIGNDEYDEHGLLLPCRAPMKWL